ncbi:TolC family protein [Meiothermus sp.]|uniref:TolC family protein n=1 Tax=Meiothermus sp. TaxID=1955249 RepID=UPI00307F3D5D
MKLKVIPLAPNTRGVLFALLLVFGFALSAGLAQPVNVFLQDAYKKDAAYLDAERSLAAAQDELRKAQSDPEIAPLLLTRAQESVAVAQAKLVQSRKEALARALEAYSGVLLGQTDLALTQQRKELTALQLQAANLRFQAGAISAAELARVRDQDAQAASAVRTAQRALDQALARLRPYGEVRVQNLPEPGTVDIDKFGIQNHARLLELQQQVREAERALALASGPDTAPLDKTARERDLARARTALGDVERTLGDTLEASKRRLQSAQENYRLARESQVRLGNELLAAQRRFQAGAIAQVMLKQAELAKAEADRSVLAAQIEVWNAIYALQVAGSN